MDKSELIRKYYIEVLEPFFPCSSSESMYMGMFNPDGDDGEIEINPNKTYQFFKESDFYINSGTELSHFTSLKSTISILSDSKIRMYSLSGLDDPNELKHIDDVISMLEKKNLSDIEYNKENFYIFSAADKSFIDKDKAIEFNLWRLYGNDGWGIELVFKYIDSHENVYNCFLSKVFYDNQTIVEEWKTKHENFENNYKCFCKGADRIIVPLSLFYKDVIYKTECEIRIVKQKSSFENQVGSIGYDFKNGKNVPYYEMPFDTSNSKSDPHMILTKIIIGYRYSLKDVDELKKTFISIARLQGKTISIEQTNLSEYFFEK
jgi:hypothetical protein